MRVHKRVRKSWSGISNSSAPLEAVIFCFSTRANTAASVIFFSAITIVLQQVWRPLWEPVALPVQLSWVDCGIALNVRQLLQCLNLIAPVLDASLQCGMLSSRQSPLLLASDQLLPCMVPVCLLLEAVEKGV